ncbi:MAG: 50S ribosomal protein L24 [Candidatus Micrarchaeota archaeon]
MTVKSSQPRKQRKVLYNCPQHKKRKLLSARLSKALRSEHKRRNFPLRKNDKVKVMSGKWAGKEGKIIKIDMKKIMARIDGINVKAGKKEKPLAIEPSKLMIMELDLSDPKRKAALGNKQVK